MSIHGQTGQNHYNKKKLYNAILKRFNYFILWKVTHTSMWWWWVIKVVEYVKNKLNNRQGKRLYYVILTAQHHHHRVNFRFCHSVSSFWQTNKSCTLTPYLTLAPCNMMRPWQHFRCRGLHLMTLFELES